MGKLIRGLIKGHRVRFLACDSKDIVQEICNLRQPTPVVCAALGRLVSVGAMMGKMEKEEDTVVSLRIQGNGPLKMMIVDATGSGKVRGYVANPYVDIPLKENGHLDVGGAVGKGILSVTKSLGLKQDFEGQVELQSGEIGDDFSYYFVVSEQTPSVVAVGVLVDVDYSIKYSGGLIVQMLPDASEEDYVFIEECSKNIKSVTKLLEKHNGNLHDIMCDIFGDTEYEESFDIEYECSCSVEKFIDLIATLPIENIEEMINEDHGAEVRCNFCGKTHNLSEEDLKQSLEKAIESKKKKENQE